MQEVEEEGKNGGGGGRVILRIVSSACFVSIMAIDYAKFNTLESPLSSINSTCYVWYV